MLAYHVPVAAQVLSAVLALCDIFTDGFSNGLEKYLCHFTLHEHFEVITYCDVVGDDVRLEVARGHVGVVALAHGADLGTGGG